MSDDGLPQWALAVGAATGFISFIFTVVDRLVLGRPIILLNRTDYNAREIMCLNSSREDIIVTRVRVTSKYVLVAQGDHHRHIAEAKIRLPFAMIIPAAGTGKFPLMVNPGDLLDNDSKPRIRFAVIVSWRKTRSMWFPQVPALLFSSVRSLRRLNMASLGNPPAEDR